MSRFYSIWSDIEDGYMQCCIPVALIIITPTFFYTACFMFHVISHVCKTLCSKVQLRNELCS